MNALRTTVPVITVLALCFAYLVGANCYFRTRANWGARDASDLNPVNLKTTPSDVVVREIFSRQDFTCDTARKCIDEIKKIQSQNVYSKNRRDIPCNFIIGINSVYEGRGWSVTSELGNRLVVCFQGNYTTAAVTQSKKNALTNVIKCGVAAGKLSSSYKLMAMRDVIKANNSNPGSNLYNFIKSQPSYSPPR